MSDTVAPQQQVVTSPSVRDQDTDRLATLAGASRMVTGLAFISAPGPVGRLLIDEDADRPGAQLFIRAFGARDVLLGAGVVLTRRDKRAQRTWLASCAFADAFDAAAALAGYGSMPPRRWGLALAISAVPALLNLTLARRLTRVTQRHRRAGSSL